MASCPPRRVLRDSDRGWPVFGVTALVLFWLDWVLVLFWLPLAVGVSVSWWLRRRGAARGRRVAEVPAW